MWDKGYYFLALYLAFEVSVIMAASVYLSSKLDKFLQIHLFIFIIPVAAFVFVIRRIYVQTKKFQKKDQ